MAIFETILGAAIPSILGGLLGKEADKATKQQTAQQPTETKTTSKTVPWDAMVPYLTGTAQQPSYLYGSPDLYRKWLEWAQGSGTGSNLEAPPPMLFDYVRAQQGIGTGGGAIDSPIYGPPANETPEQRVGSNPVNQNPPQLATPTPQPAPTPSVADVARDLIPVFDPQNPGRFLGWEQGFNTYTGGTRYVDPRTGRTGSISFQDYFAQ